MTDRMKYEQKKNKHRKDFMPCLSIVSQYCGTEGTAKTAL